MIDPDRLRGIRNGLALPNLGVDPPRRRRDDKNRVRSRNRVLQGVRAVIIPGDDLDAPARQRARPIVVGAYGPEPERDVPAQGGHR